MENDKEDIVELPYEVIVFSHLPIKKKKKVEMKVGFKYN